jgi:hypothetical protein
VPSLELEEIATFEGDFILVLELPVAGRPLPGSAPQLQRRQYLTRLRPELDTRTAKDPRGRLPWLLTIVPDWNVNRPLPSSFTSKSVRAKV